MHDHKIAYLKRDIIFKNHFEIPSLYKSIALNKMS